MGPTMETTAYNKLLPEPTPDTQPYWDGLKTGRLMLQSCGSCGRVRHYPRPVCPHCYSMDVRWVEAKGQGKVHSWTVTHHAFHPGWKGELPITLVTVDLEEGVRMQAELRGPVSEGSLKIGAPVRIAFNPVTPEVTLPVFVLDKS
jgi:uncharacterized OB-fold protein